ncbi:hypothetical protein [Reyranella sp.]|uniref:hypothetical protein n=1 Tax=Reyranella sp. TaxID=1929291 RepID=UPI0011FFF5EE|nr:hypothetical protein [Reyranella sp.]TAJ86146.1 MAG: hypothetical protein EPO50_15460 [Reyranella sp.]
MRSVWRAFLGALLVVCLAATASAQNGLERFEKDIKPQLELKKFTYADARPLGTSGFILNNVVAVVPASEATNDKETTVKIEKLTVDELDFDRLKKNSKDDASPRFAKLKIEGMTGDDELFSSLEPYGVPKVPVDLALDYRIDPAAKVLTLNTLEINLRGQAKINLALVMDGISDKSDMGSAKDDGRLRSASLTLDDKELLAKLVPAFAKEEGSTAGELVGGALDALAGFAQMQTGETLKALDAVSSFLLDWKAPKGPLVVGLKPTKTAGLDDLDKIAVPNALSTIFGFTATYPATRAGAAKAGSKEK